MYGPPGPYGATPIHDERSTPARDPSRILAIQPLFASDAVQRALSSTRYRLFGVGAHNVAVAHCISDVLMFGTSDVRKKVASSVDPASITRLE
jgi:hypothetical protein